MRQFSLKEYLANPERKVVTREGQEVEIISTIGREPYPVIGYVGHEDDNIGVLCWTSDGCLYLSSPSDDNLFFAEEEVKPITNLPKWHRAKAGTRISEAVIIYDIDPEPRLGKVMVNDGRYMLVKELEELPEE